MILTRPLQKTYKLEKGKALPVGTIRDWGGTKYRKAGPGDWQEVKGERQHHQAPGDEPKPQATKQSVLEWWKTLDPDQRKAILDEIRPEMDKLTKDSERMALIVKYVTSQGLMKKQEPEATVPAASVETKDAAVVEALTEVTPETRVVAEAKVFDMPKEPWALTFEEYKKQLMEFRDESVLKQLRDRIAYYEKELARQGKGISGDVASWERTMKARLQRVKDFLEGYEEGRLDSKENENPSWDYIQKEYDALKDKNSPEAKALKRKLTIRENKARTEHERLITNAVKDGKVVPANVLKEYPSIQSGSKAIIQRPDVNYVPGDLEKVVYRGGEVTDDNKRVLKIKDYSKVLAKDVFLANDETILDVPRPSYIPEMDLEDFSGYKGRDQHFDIARLGVNQYLIVDKRYKTEKTTGWRNADSLKVKNVPDAPETDHISESNYYLMNAETLAATWDYYRKLYKATELRKNEVRQDREEKYYNERKAKALAAGQPWKYAAFQRSGIRPASPQPVPDSMRVSQGHFIQDIEGHKGTEAEMRHGPLNVKIFHNYQTMLKEMEYKIGDLRMQKKYDDENNTFAKGQATAYGDSGLKKDLVSSHGVTVKRQNGTEISPQDIGKIGMLMEDVYSVFGNRKGMSEKFGLKVSYAGKTRMHASKAIGLFIKSMKCIAISDQGIAGRGLTFAHEFSHFMDSYLGEKVNNHFASDQEGTVSSEIAKKFRKSMSLNTDKMGKDTAQYYNRTCECFARALEQYYSVKQGVHEELYTEFGNTGAYVEHETFVAEIMPLVDRFFTENEELLKSMRLVWSLEKGKTDPPGTVRDWKGRKFQKQANGEWKPVKGPKKARAPRVIGSDTFARADSQAWTYEGIPDQWMFRSAIIATINDVYAGAPPEIKAIVDSLGGKPSKLVQGVQSHAVFDQLREIANPYNVEPTRDMREAADILIDMMYKWGQVETAVRAIEQSKKTNFSVERIHTTPDGSGVNVEFEGHVQGWGDVPLPKVFVPFPKLKTFLATNDVNPQALQYARKHDDDYRRWAGLVHEKITDALTGFKVATGLDLKIDNELVDTIAPEIIVDYTEKLQRTCRALNKHFDLAGYTPPDGRKVALTINDVTAKAALNGQDVAAHYVPIARLIEVSPKYTNTVGHEYGHYIFETSGRGFEDTFMIWAMNSGYTERVADRLKMLGGKAHSYPDSYWLSPTELFARAFDAYLRMKGGRPDLAQEKANYEQGDPYGYGWGDLDPTYEMLQSTGKGYRIGDMVVEGTNFEQFLKIRLGEGLIKSIRRLVLRLGRG